MADIYGEGSNSRRQWQKLKGAPLKDKVRYIVQYYGIPIVAVVAIVIFAVSMTRTIIRNSVPMIISIESYNGAIADDAGEALMAKIAPLLEADPAKYQIEVNGTPVDAANVQEAITVSQKVVARIAARDLDCIIANKIFLSSYMGADDPDNRAFFDLREVLSDEMYQRLVSEDRVVMLSTSDGEEVPYAILLDGTDLAETIGLLGKENYLSFVVTTKRPEAQKALGTLIWE